MLGAMLGAMLGMTAWGHDGMGGMMGAVLGVLIAGAGYSRRKVWHG